MSQVMLGLVVAALWSIPTSDDSVAGRATYYADGLMEQVAENRGRSLTGYVGGIALNRAGDLGRIVWLEWPDPKHGWLQTTIEGPFLNVDCSQRRHFAERERRRLVVEVDAQTAQRRGFYEIAPAPVRVWFVNPEPAQPVRELDRAE